MATRESDLHIYRDGKRPVTPPSDNVVPAGAKMKDAIKKYSLKSMEGRVFINWKKPGSKQANLRGLINIKDVHYVMAGWFRRQKDNKNPFYALRLRRIKTDNDEKMDDSTQIHLQKNGAGKDFSLHNMEGRVFKSKKRIRHNFPDIRGLIDLEDVLYDVSGWYHIGEKSHKRYYALLLREHTDSNMETDRFCEDILQDESRLPDAPYPSLVPGPEIEDISPKVFDDSETPRDSDSYPEFEQGIPEVHRVPDNNPDNQAFDFDIDLPF